MNDKNKIDQLVDTYIKNIKQNRTINNHQKGELASKIIGIKDQFLKYDEFEEQILTQLTHLDSQIICPPEEQTKLYIPYISFYRIVQQKQMSSKQIDQNMNIIQSDQKCLQMSKIQQEQLEIKKYGIFDVVYQNYKRNEHNFSEEYKQELKNKIKQYKDQVNDRKNPSTKIFTEQEYKQLFDLSFFNQQYKEKLNNYYLILKNYYKNDQIKYHEQKYKLDQYKSFLEQQIEINENNVLLFQYYRSQFFNPSEIDILKETIAKLYQNFRKFLEILNHQQLLNQLDKKVEFFNISELRKYLQQKNALELFEESENRTKYICQIAKIYINFMQMEYTKTFKDEYVRKMQISKLQNQIKEMYNKFQYQLCEFMNQLSAADTSLFENFKNMHPQYSTINEKIKEFNIKKQQIQIQQQQVLLQQKQPKQQKLSQTKIEPQPQELKQLQGGLVISEKIMPSRLVQPTTIIQQSDNKAILQQKTPIIKAEEAPTSKSFQINQISAFNNKNGQKPFQYNKQKLIFNDKLVEEQLKTLCCQKSLQLQDKNMIISSINDIFKAYMTSFVYRLLQSSIVENIDNEFRLFCSKQLDQHLVPFKNQQIEKYQSASCFLSKQQQSLKYFAIQSENKNIKRIQIENYDEDEEKLYYKLLSEQLLFPTELVENMKKKKQRKGPNAYEELETNLKKCFKQQNGGRKEVKSDSSVLGINLSTTNIQRKKITVKNIQIFLEADPVYKKSTILMKTYIS